MSTVEITSEDVSRFVGLREVDLVIVTPPDGFELALRGQFDDYGEFLTILARDIEYVELVSRFTVGGLRLVANFSEVVGWSGASKWRRRVTTCSGLTLVVRDADAESWDAASAEDLYVVVASTIKFIPGPGWELPPL